MQLSSFYRFKHSILLVNSYFLKDEKNSTGSSLLLISYLILDFITKSTCCCLRSPILPIFVKNSTEKNATKLKPATHCVKRLVHLPSVLSCSCFSKLETSWVRRSLELLMKKDPYSNKVTKQLCQDLSPLNFSFSDSASSISSKSF